MSKPTELIKEYESLESEIFAMQDEIEEAEEARGELNEALKQWAESHKGLVNAVNDFREGRKTICT